MKSALSLTAHNERTIKKLLASGRFGNRSEVVRAGLRMLEDAEGELTALREELKRRAKEKD
jgi:antitoxin ParD1/3/4